VSEVNTAWTGIVSIGWVVGVVLVCAVVCVGLGIPVSIIGEE